LSTKQVGLLKLAKDRNLHFKAIERYKKHKKTLIKKQIKNLQSDFIRQQQKKYQIKK
jgi:hypothetical protein